MTLLYQETKSRCIGDKEIYILNDYVLVQV